MKIKIEIDVFDDPENCHDGKTECYYLEEGCCRAFRAIIQCGHKKEIRCKEAYQMSLDLKIVNGESNLEKELGEFMKRNLSPNRKPFHVLMSEKYPDVEYQLMLVDEKGFQKLSPTMDIVTKDQEVIKSITEDMSLYGIEVKVVDKLKEIGQECGFECEKFGIPEGSAPDHCKECIHTPPF